MHKIALDPFKYDCKFTLNKLVLRTPCIIMLVYSNWTCFFGYMHVSESFFFSSMALYYVIKGGIPCMGTSPGRMRAHTSTRAREQEHTHQRASFGLRKSSEALHRTCSRKNCHFVFRPRNQLCHQRSVFLVVREG